jgi:uncharacterized protein (UPF0276 family)
MIKKTLTIQFDSDEELQFIKKVSNRLSMLLDEGLNKRECIQELLCDNELLMDTHPSEIHGDDWWIFQEYVEKLNNGETLSEEEEDEISTLEEEYDWDRYDCELL